MTDELPEPDPAEAELIAYLDGELTPAAARRVAARLAADPQLRARATALRQSFALLDYLPKPEPSSTFVSRTLEQLPAAGTRPASISTPTLPTPSVQVPRVAPGRTWGWAAATAAAAGLAAALGYLLTAAVRPPPPPGPDPAADPLTLADARVVENLPLYALADGLHFLDRLAAPEFFGGDIRPVPGAPPAEPDQPTGPALAALANTFRALPPDQREAVRRLDRELYEQPADRRDHLLRALETYAAWVHRLPDPDRGRVLAAPTADKRLDAVRDVRRARWVAALPAAHRDQLQPLPPGARTAQLDKWKAEDDRRHELWRATHLQWDAGRAASPPWPFDDDRLRREVVEFARAAYRPDDPARPTRLTPAEQERLLEALFFGESLHDWGRLGRLVADLGRKYETLPEPADGQPVVRFDQLPPKLRDFYGGRDRFRARLEAKAGKWPDFALGIWDDAQAVKGPALPPGLVLGPSRPAEFAPDVRRVLVELRKKATEDEVMALATLEGKWPAYPRELVRLARAHDLSVPGALPPGPPSRWDKQYPPPKAGK